MLDRKDLEAIASLMDMKLEPIRTDLEEVKNRVTKIEEKTGSIEQRVTKIEEKTDSIEQRVTKIEEKTDSIERRVTKIEVVQENVTNKNILLLAEGHQDAIEKLKKIDTLEEKVIDIQDTVEVLKAFTVRK